jgi:hypothetical protein
MILKEAYKDKFYKKHRYGCLGFNSGNTEQETALFIRTIDNSWLRFNAGNTEHDLQETALFIMTTVMIG